jgi:hypothetical protein
VSGRRKWGCWGPTDGVQRSSVTGVGETRPAVAGVRGDAPGDGLSRGRRRADSGRSRGSHQAGGVGRRGQVGGWPVAAEFLRVAGGAGGSDVRVIRRTAVGGRQAGGGRQAIGWAGWAG